MVVKLVVANANVAVNVALKPAVEFKHVVATTRVSGCRTWLSSNVLSQACANMVSLICNDQLL